MNDATSGGCAPTRVASLTGEQQRGSRRNCPHLAAAGDRRRASQAIQARVSTQTMAGESCYRLASWVAISATLGRYCLRLRIRSSRRRDSSRRGVRSPSAMRVVPHE